MSTFVELINDQNNISTYNFLANNLISSEYENEYK